MKKKVLVIGATGALGSYVVPELLELGFAVDGITLDEVSSDHPDLRYITGRVDDAMLIRLFEGGRYAGIIDFMHYSADAYESRHKLLLENTDHLIFLSSYRTYADLEHPIRETSPSFLDSSTDEYFLANETYAIWKSKCERILRASKYDNYTIVRPLISSSKRRYDLITTGAGDLIGRARENKPILLPIEARDKVAGLGWAGNVGKMMARLLASDDTFCEAYTLGSGEIHTWGEIADFYVKRIGVQPIWVDTATYLKYATDGSDAVRWMLECDRLLDRTIDNSKVLAATGLAMSDFVDVYTAMDRELAELPEDYRWRPNPAVAAKMDEFIKTCKE
ncbi:MAG: NAD-dependent epimerase/dehydratase family protein [Ruminococcaceae bacterium]|nr:NAD-dependent epimerase/dehydratase family protein [Oscillospiraceae bacterium]